MKPEELRIGNWVKTKKEEQVIDVLSDSVNTMTWECCPYDLIEPIPLTEQWLKKFGWHDLHHLIPISLRQYNNGDWQAKVFRQTICVNLKYVHQLQNLYYALTGEELKKRPVKDRLNTNPKNHT